MKKMKNAWGIPAVMLVFALVITGCDNGTTNGGSDITWTLEQAGGNLDAGGSPVSDTTQIKITFSEAVSLTVDNVAVTGSFGSAGGQTLSNDGTVLTISITVTKSEYATVIINKSGIEHGPKQVMVYKKGSAPPAGYSVAANGNSDTVTSAQLTFAFNKAVTGLTIDDITITNGTGSASGGTPLSGSGTDWILPINVTKQGNITVKINREGITDAEKIVAVYRKAEAAAKSVTITGLGAYNGNAVNVIIFSNLDDFEEIILKRSNIYGEGDIANGIVTIPLYDNNDNLWTGTGSLYAGLGIKTDNNYFGEIWVSKAAVNFSAANHNPSIALSGFEKYAFSFKFNDIAEYAGIDLTPEMTINDWIYKTSGEFYTEWSSETGIKIYKDKAMAAEVAGNTIIDNVTFYMNIPIWMLMNGGQYERLYPYKLVSGVLIFNPMQRGDGYTPYTPEDPKCDRWIFKPNSGSGGPALIGTWENEINFESDTQTHIEWVKFGTDDSYTFSHSSYYLSKNNYTHKATDSYTGIISLLSGDYPYILNSDGTLTCNLIGRGDGTSKYDVNHPKCPKLIRESGTPGSIIGKWADEESSSSENSLYYNSYEFKSDGVMERISIWKMEENGTFSIDGSTIIVKFN